MRLSEPQIELKQTPQGNIAAVSYKGHYANSGIQASQIEALTKLLLMVVENWVDSYEVAYKNGLEEGRNGSS